MQVCVNEIRSSGLIFYSHNASIQKTTIYTATTAFQVSLLVQNKMCDATIHHLGPFPNGIKVDSSVDESSSQLTAPSLEGVCPECDWPLEFVGLNACNGFWDAEHAQEGVKHEIIVAVVSRQVPFELIHVLGSRLEWLLDNFALSCSLLLLLFCSLQAEQGSIS